MVVEGRTVTLYCLGDFLSKRVEVSYHYQTKKGEPHGLMEMLIFLTILTLSLSKYIENTILHNIST